MTTKKNLGNQYSTNIQLSNKYSIFNQYSVIK